MRRRFRAAYKVWIVEMADGCETPGKIVQLLRRGGFVRLASVRVV